MTLDEALKNATRCLEKAEDAPEAVANKLVSVADRWLRTADLLLIRDAPIR